MEILFSVYAEKLIDGKKPSMATICPNCNEVHQFNDNGQGGNQDIYPNDFENVLGCIGFISGNESICATGIMECLKCKTWFGFDPC